MGKIIKENLFSHFSVAEAQSVFPGEDEQEAGVMWTESPGVKRESIPQMEAISRPRQEGKTLLWRE